MRVVLKQASMAAGEVVCFFACRLCLQPMFGAESLTQLSLMLLTCATKLHSLLCIVYDTACSRYLRVQETKRQAHGEVVAPFAPPQMLVKSCNQLDGIAGEGRLSLLVARCWFRSSGASFSHREPLAGSALKSGPCASRALLIFAVEHTAQHDCSPFRSSTTNDTTTSAREASTSALKCKPGPYGSIGCVSGTDAGFTGSDVLDQVFDPAHGANAGPAVGTGRQTLLLLTRYSRTRNPASPPFAPELGTSRRTPVPNWLPVTTQQYTSETRT